MGKNKKNKKNVEKQEEQKKKNASTIITKLGIAVEITEKELRKYLQSNDLEQIDKDLIQKCLNEYTDEETKQTWATNYCETKLTELKEQEEAIETEQQQLATDQQQLEIDKQQLATDQQQLETDKQQLATSQQEYDQKKNGLEAEYKNKQNELDIEYKKKRAELYLEEQTYEKEIEKNLNDRHLTKIQDLQATIRNLKDENDEKVGLEESLEEYEKNNRNLKETNLKLQKSLDEKNALLQENVTKVQGIVDDTTQKWQELTLAAVTNTKAELESFTEKLKEQTKEYKKAKQELENALNDGDIFDGLSKIEIEENHQEEADITSLHDLCTKFRAYAQNCSKELYYEEEAICSFIAGLNSSQIMILEGKSGTGKTSLPRVFADFLGNSKLTSIIPVQPSWKDKYDLLGFYNDFTHKFKETEFLKALYTALKDKDNIHIIMLDEMNLSRIEYYFADFLSVLELKPNEWKINLLPGNLTSDVLEKVNPDHDGSAISIGKNVWFVGTANKDDSTFDITDKVYDRASVLRFNKQGTKEKDLPKNTATCYVTYGKIRELFDKVTTPKSFDYETYLSKISTELEKFDIVIGNREKLQIQKFVPTYCLCKGDTNMRDSNVREAIDIILRNKVLRQLDSKSLDSSHKTELESLKEALENGYKESYTFVDKKIKEIEK